MSIGTKRAYLVGVKRTHEQTWKVIAEDEAEAERLIQEAEGERLSPAVGAGDRLLSGAGGSARACPAASAGRDPLSEALADAQALVIASARQWAAAKARERESGSAWWQAHERLDQALKAYQQAEREAGSSDPDSGPPTPFLRAERALEAARQAERAAPLPLDIERIENELRQAVTTLVALQGE
jgi:hypothetical protein